MSDRASFTLYFNINRNQLTSQEDAVVCYVHWLMISGGYTCVDNHGKVCENNRLPNGWRSTNGLYTLLYHRGVESDLYSLKIISKQDHLSAGIYRPDGSVLSTMDVPPQTYRHIDMTSADSAFRDLSPLRSRITTDLVTMSGHCPPNSHALPGVCNIGRSDLDPFASQSPCAPGGGGMIFDPLRSGCPPENFRPDGGASNRFGRGAVPPGARFESPFPPDLDASGNVISHRPPRSGPDPDHMRRPGFEDGHF